MGKEHILLYQSELMRGHIARKEHTGKIQCVTRLTTRTDQHNALPILW